MWCDAKVTAFWPRFELSFRFFILHIPTCGLAFQSKNQKKSRATANHVAEETFGSVPHSFVFNRGQVGKNVGQLIRDMRKVMMPYTAESLKVRLQIVLLIKQLVYYPTQRGFLIVNMDGLGSDDDKLRLDCSVICLQSKRTDEPPAITKSIPHAAADVTYT